MISFIRSQNTLASGTHIKSYDPSGSNFVMISKHPREMFLLVAFMTETFTVSGTGAGSVWVAAAATTVQCYFWSSDSAAPSSSHCSVSAD